MTTASRCKRSVHLGVPIGATGMDVYAAKGSNRKSTDGMAAIYRTMQAVDRSIQRDKVRSITMLPSMEAEYTRLLAKLNVLEASLDLLLTREAVLTARLKSPNVVTERTQQARRAELRQISTRYEQTESSLEDIKGTMASLAARIRRARAAKRELEGQSALATDTSSEQLIS